MNSKSIIEELENLIKLDLSEDVKKRARLLLGEFFTISDSTREEKMQAEVLFLRGGLVTNKEYFDLARQKNGLKPIVLHPNQTKTPESWTTDLFTLLSTEIAPPKWLIENIWTDESVGFVAGEPKGGKTWAALDMALSIASGKSCFGKFQPQRLGHVLYMAEEGKTDEIRRRLHLLAAGKQIEAETMLNFRLSIQQGIQIDQNAWKDTINHYCEKFNPVALFFDPLVRIHSAKEDSADAMKPILAYLRSLQVAYHCSVIIVHHMRKPSEEDKARTGQKLRGTGDFYAWLDSALYLERKRGESAIGIQAEHRDAEELDPFTLILNSSEEMVTLSYQEGSLENIRVTEISQQIITLLQNCSQGMLQRDLDNKIGGKTVNRYNALNLLKEENRIHEVKEVRPGSTGKPRRQTVWYLGDNENTSPSLL